MKKIFLLFVLTSLISITFAQDTTGFARVNWNGMKAVQDETTLKQKVFPGQAVLTTSPVLFNEDGFALNTCPNFISMHVVAYNSTTGTSSIKPVIVHVPDENQPGGLDYFRFNKYPMYISLVQRVELIQGGNPTNASDYVVTYTGSFIR